MEKDKVSGERGDLHPTVTPSPCPCSQSPALEEREVEIQEDHGSDRHGTSSSRRGDHEAEGDQLYRILVTLIW